MEFKTDNGIKVVINAAPFIDAINLKNAILQKIKIPTDLDIRNPKDLKKANSIIERLQNLDIAPFLETLMQVDADIKVNEALMKCLNRCTYNSEKITETTFDNENAREDYYTIIFYCIKVNLYPFFKGLILKLNGLSNQFTKSTQN